MNKLIEISKITINIGDKKIELSVEEAKALMVALKDMLGAEEVIEKCYPIPYIQPYPVYPPTYPGTYPGNPYWYVTYTCGGATVTPTISLYQ